MRYACALPVLGCLLLACALLCPVDARGQSPLGPSFSTAIRTSSLGSMSGVSFSKIFTYNVSIDERHALFVSAEYVKAASVPKVVAEQFNMKPAWRFSAVPITVGYAYTLGGPGRRIHPVVGVGISAYFCQAKHLPGGEMIYDSADAARHAVRQSLGAGYGMQATLGLRADLTRSFFALLQGRARYVDGLAFAPGDAEAAGARFTNVDFALGLGFKF